MAVGKDENNFQTLSDFNSSAEEAEIKDGVEYPSAINEETKLPKPTGMMNKRNVAQKQSNISSDTVVKGVEHISTNL